MKYEQIVINTVDDLPKKEGSYISKRKTKDYVGTHLYKGEDYNEIWFRTIEWYLLPIESDLPPSEEKKEIKPPIEGEHRQYNHKCINCGIIFKNDLVYKSSRIRLCPECNVK